MKRNAISYIGTALSGLLLAAAAMGSAAQAACPAYTGPLATPAQNDAERLALKLAARPEVQALRPQLREMLKADPAAQWPDGAREIERAIDQFSMTLIFWEISGADTSRPAVRWQLDNTPRCWFGHTFPGTAASGDNPDNIYRGAFLDGSSSYEISGKMSPTGVAQFSLELSRGSPGKMVMTRQASSSPDLGNQVAVVMTGGMKVLPDGTFTVTIGPEDRPGDPNHMKTVPGPLTLNVRDTLADWSQQPTALTIRRTGGPVAAQPPSEDEITKRIVADLPDFVRFWSTFKTGWLGGIKDNAIVGPVPRDGGWGFLAGGRFHLSPDQAMVITVNEAGSKYHSIQVTTPWFIIPNDADKFIVNRNNTQVRRDADGNVTYVVASRDPGYANWIDTAGFERGLLILRWQNVPQEADGKSLLKAYSVVPVAELAKAVPATTPTVSEDERKAEITARHTDYARRLGTPVTGGEPAN